MGPGACLPALLSREQEEEPQGFVTCVRALLLFCFLLSYGFFGPCLTACGILVPRPGVEPVTLHWKSAVLTTELPGKSVASPGWEAPRADTLLHVAKYICMDSSQTNL